MPIKQRLTAILLLSARGIWFHDAQKNNPFFFGEGVDDAPPIPKVGGARLTYSSVLFLPPNGQKSNRAGQNQEHQRARFGHGVCGSDIRPAADAQRIRRDGSCDKRSA
jgi:hypothetical protein